jgi:hypothetical protein
MIKKILMAMLAAALFANVCKAQSNSSQSVTNWGESVNGVQLSISLSNNILAAGSSTTVHYRVKNSSTNTVGWGVVNATQGFAVFLTNSAGKIYRLTPAPDTNSEVISVNYALVRKVKAGGSCEGSVPIVVGKEIKPGNCQLEAIQYFFIGGKRPRHELVSNLLEVHIK